MVAGLSHDIPRRSRKKATKPESIAIRVLDHATFEFRLLHKNLLTVPHDEYQRDESKGLIAKDIALNFNKVAFGALTVIERKVNGKPIYKVADGGTRLAASLMRDDVEWLPCLIFSGLTAEQEADVFLAINQNRRRLQIEQLHQGEVFAGRELALEADRILFFFKDRRIDFNALAALRQCVRRYAKQTNLIVSLLGQCAADKHLGVRVFKGLIYLEVHLNKYDRTLNDRRRVIKLREKFGLLDASINAAFGAQNIRSNDAHISARAIAKVIGVNYPR